MGIRWRGGIHGPVGLGPITLAWALVACGGAPPKPPPPAPAPVVVDTGVPDDRDPRRERISREEHAAMYAHPAWSEALAKALKTEPTVTGESPVRRRWRLEEKLEKEYFDRGVCQMGDDEILEQRRLWIRMLASPRLVCVYENGGFTWTPASIDDVINGLSDEDLHALMRFRANAAVHGLDAPTGCDEARASAPKLVEEGSARTWKRIRPRDLRRIREIDASRARLHPPENDETCYVVRTVEGSSLGLNPGFRARYFRALLLASPAK